MIESSIFFLKSLPKGLITLILASLPISELRGAIPFGLSMNQGLGKTFCLAVLGNLIPVVPLLFGLEPISIHLRRFKLWRGFFEWLFNRTKRRAKIVQKYGAVGLALFVAIPFPVTGAWTGCVAATLFKIRFRYAFSAIAVGVVIAGFIVTILTLSGRELFYLSRGGI